MGEEEKIITVYGVVRWFDANKGYGFVNADGFGDILLHANVLRNFGQSSVSDGTPVVVEIRRTLRGFQATAVVRFEQSFTKTDGNVEIVTSSLGENYEHLEVQPARVKWYDPKKGYGFVTLFGRSDDVFLHGELLRISGLGRVAPGEAVAVRVAENESGLSVVQTLSWGEAEEWARSKGKLH